MPILKIKDKNSNWLNITAIKGERGEQGVQGTQGPPGPIGLPGEQGIQGPPGKTPEKYIDYFTEQDLKDLDNNYIHKYISLISISETPPISFSLGDKYLNTIDKCIYTAIDSEHWSDFSEEIVENVFYIDETSGKLYYYKNNTIKELYKNIQDYITNPKLTIFWTNPNPLAAFDETNIELKNDAYDFLEIYYYDWDTEGFRNVCSTRILKGYDGTFSTFFNNNNHLYFGERTLKRISDTQFKISKPFGVWFNGNNFLTENINSVCVPIFIYGGRF